MKVATDPGSAQQDPSTGERTWQYRGNSSEAPIVVAARKVGLPEDMVLVGLKEVPKVSRVPIPPISR